MEYIALGLAVLCLLAVGPLAVLGLLAYRSQAAQVKILGESVDHLQTWLTRLEQKTPLEDRITATEQKISALQLRVR